MKRNDTSPYLKATLSSANSLVGATVVFNMQKQSGEAVISRGDVVILDAAAKTVEYRWAAGDTANAGAYLGEFEVTYTDGKVETFPNVGFIPINIERDIA